MAASVKSIFSLGGSSKKVPLHLKLKDDFDLTLIKSPTYSGANP